MTTSFDRAFERVLLVEGGYGNDPADRGGATRYGITEATARANGYAGEMRALPLEEAKRIYKAQYWSMLRLDEIAALSYPIAEELFDTGVNMGVVASGKFLQSALNAFNREGRDYPDLEVDGAVGPMTVHALAKFTAARGPQGETVLMRALNALQGARYLDIAKNDPTQEKFTFGWFLQRVS
jgi:lysozyme family protein